MLRLHDAAVDTDVIDEAEPEAAGGKAAAKPDAQAAGRYRPAGLIISGDFEIIDIENAILTLPDKTCVMPGTVGDEGPGCQRFALAARSPQVRHRQEQLSLIRSPFGRMA